MHYGCNTRQVSFQKKKRPDMTLDVYRGRKTTIQQSFQKYDECLRCLSIFLSYLYSIECIASVGYEYSHNLI